MIHELKILPKYFKDVIYFKKTFEIRKNDRNFKIDDALILKEYDPNTKTFTGNYATAKVKYVLKDKDFPSGIKEGYCIIGLNLQEVYKKIRYTKPKIIIMDEVDKNFSGCLLDSFFKGE